MMFAVLELWRMATAAGEFYRDKQDERDGQDTVVLMQLMNFGLSGGLSGLWSVGKCGCDQIKRCTPRPTMDYVEDVIVLASLGLNRQPV